MSEETTTETVLYEIAKRHQTGIMLPFRQQKPPKLNMALTGFGGSAINRPESDFGYKRRSYFQMDTIKAYLRRAITMDR